MMVVVIDKGSRDGEMGRVIVKAARMDPESLAPAPRIRHGLAASSFFRE
jgi:hypothetical protein